MYWTLHILPGSRINLGAEKEKYSGFIVIIDIKFKIQCGSQIHKCVTARGSSPAAQ
jgi:hypothetical protein